MTSIIFVVAGWMMRRWRVIFAAMFGFLLVAPLVWFVLAEPSYQGIFPAGLSDEPHYVSILREVAEGNWLHRNTYLWEEKQSAPNIFMFTELGLGPLFRLFVFRVDVFLVFMKILGIAGAVYLLGYGIEGARPDLPRVWAWSAAAGAIALPYILGPSLLRGAWSALTFAPGAFTDFVWWTRFTNPVVSGLWLTGGIALLLRLAIRPSHRTALLLGAVIGTAAWIYIYFWIFLCVLLGLWLAAQAVRRDRERLRAAVLALCVTAAFSLPYLAFVRWEMGLPGQGINAPVLTHKVIIEWSVLIVVLGWFLVTIALRHFRRERWSEGDLALACLGLAALVAVNQQVITGRSIQPHHFYFLVDKPVAALLFVLAGAELARAFLLRRAAVWMGAAALVLVVWIGAGIQTVSMGTQWGAFRDVQRLAPAFAEIRSRGYPLVVLSDEDTSELVPMYTRADVYYAPHANTYTSTSYERRKHAWYVRARLLGITDEKSIRPYFEAQREYIGGYVFESQYWRDRNGCRGCFPDAVLDELVEGYRSFLKQDFQKELRTYRADVVLWDERRWPEWKLEQYPFLQKTGQWNGVSLWLFRSQVNNFHDA